MPAVDPREDDLGGLAAVERINRQQVDQSPPQVDPDHVPVDHTDRVGVILPATANQVLRCSAQTDLSQDDLQVLGGGDPRRSARSRR